MIHGYPFQGLSMSCKQ